ncbi:MAG: substrate-binding domain-containing protein [Bacteroidaceae bacterium]|nr:substrate-binding domain-containing protein [Bacteroidaceae bacterium]
MKKYLNYAFLGLLLTGFAIASCDNSDKRGGRTDTPTSGEISFAADESFSPVIGELIDQFQFKYPKAKLNPIYTNENDGFNLIKEMKTCLFFTSRPLKDSEVAYLKTKKQLPSVFPIGYDGLAIIVNPNNNDTCISVKDFKRILQGEVTKWNEVYKNSKLGDFEVVFDNNQSATLHYVVDSILDGKPIDNPHITAAKTSADVIDYVHDTPNAIGVIGSNWLNDKRDSTNLTFIKNIRVMSVSVKDEATPSNSWKPYQAYLLDGRYPFARTIYAICVDPQRALPWSFANYVTSPVGQLIVLKTGLLPYRGDITLKKVNIKK